MRRILIADDNDAIRGVLGQLLRRHDGWEVCADVKNGQEAVLKAIELKPNVIILDLAMPMMDGLQPTREITQILPAVPIIIYTLHKSSWLELDAKKAGARLVVSKRDTDALVRAAETVLNTQSEDSIAAP